jgi:DNA-binding Lrp family transcriptional regulator
MGEVEYIFDCRKLYILGVNNYLPEVNKMVSLTENEARTIEFLIRNFSKEYNINQLAKELNISPGGMFKILKKLKTQGFLTEKKLGNNIFYKINYNSQDALDTCTFSLTEKRTTPYIRAWMKDLEKLKPKTKLAILFGSILKKDRKARDIDILLVFDKRNLKDVENLIDRINRIKSKKIHAIYQTREDLLKNIKKRDKAILEEVRTGVILWGRNFLVEVIKNGQS